MCFPVVAAGAAAAGTAATVSTIATVAGAAVSAFGMVQQARAAKAQAAYQAQVQRNNQIYLNRQAERTRQEGDIAAQEARRRARQLLGRQKAVFAGQGVDVGSGTAVDIFGDTAAFGELDALTLRDRAETQAISLEQQGANQGAQANLTAAAGRSQYASGLTSATGTILNSAGTVASRWYRFRSAGVEGLPLDY